MTSLLVENETKLKSRSRHLPKLCAGHRENDYAFMKSSPDLRNRKSLVYYERAEN